MPRSLTGVLNECSARLTSGPSGGEWPNGILSSDAVRGPSGRVGRVHEVFGAPNPVAAALVQSAIDELTPLLAGLDTQHLGTAKPMPLEPFFAIATEYWRCEKITADSIRGMFGTALYVDATITVEDLNSSFVRALAGKVNAMEVRRQWALPGQWLTSPPFVESSQTISLRSIVSLEASVS